MRNSATSCNKIYPLEQMSTFHAQEETSHIMGEDLELETD